MEREGGDGEESDLMYNVIQHWILLGQKDVMSEKQLHNEAFSLCRGIDRPNKNASCFFVGRIISVSG